MSFDAQKQWGDRGRLAKLQKARDHLLSQARQPVSAWNRDGKVANALARRAAAAAAGELRIAVVNYSQRHQQNFGLQAKPLLQCMAVLLSELAANCYAVLCCVQPRMIPHLCAPSQHRWVAQFHPTFPPATLCSCWRARPWSCACRGARRFPRTLPRTSCLHLTMLSFSILCPTGWHVMSAGTQAATPTMAAREYWQPGGMERGTCNLLGIHPIA